MPFYKTTFLFNQSPYGWSESYFRTEASYADAATAATLLAPLRMNLAVNNVELTGIRISDEAFRGDSYVINSTTDPAIPRFGTFPANLGGKPVLPSETETCYVLRLEAQNPTGFESSRRIQLLRGLPENIVLGNNFNPNPTWEGYLAQFTLQLLLGYSLTRKVPWQLRQQQARVSVPADPQRMVSITPNASDPRYIDVVVPTQWTIGAVLTSAGTAFLIRGVRGSNGLNGRWIQSNAGPGGVVVVGGFKYTFGPHRHLAAVVQPAAGATIGTIFPVGYAGADIIRAVPERRLSTRESGRPFGLPVGRRRAT